MYEPSLAFKEGAIAGYKGYEMSECPYEACTQSSVEYQRGYIAYVNTKGSQFDFGVPFQGGK